MNHVKGDNEMLRRKIDILLTEEIDAHLRKLARVKWDGSITHSPTAELLPTESLERLRRHLAYAVFISENP